MGRLPGVRHPRVALALASIAAFAALSFDPARAAAHQVGVSRGEYVASGTHLDAHVTLARRDLLLTVAGIDADGDGALSQAELDQKRSELAAMFAEKTAVTESGAACPGKLVGATLDEPDGVALELAFDCPSSGQIMSIELGFIAELGPGHRHLAHAVGNTSARAPADDIFYRGKSHLDVPVSQSHSGPGGALVAGVGRALRSVDALLVLAGLALVARRARDAAVEILAFAVGVAATSAIALLSGLGPSPEILAALTAVSVLYVGLEDLFAGDSRRRAAIALSLGGVHGFALPAIVGQASAAAALAAVGVYLAAGALAAAVFGVLGARRGFHPWGRAALAVAIAIAGAARLAVGLSRLRA